MIRLVNHWCTTSFMVTVINLILFVTHDLGCSGRGLYRSSHVDAAGERRHVMATSMTKLASGSQIIGVK